MYIIFLNILNNSIISLKDYYNYQDADYLNTLSIDELNYRSLLNNKKDASNLDIQKAILYITLEVLKIVLGIPNNPLLEDIDIQILLIIIVSYKYYLSNLGIKYFTISITKLDNIIIIYQ